MYIKQCYSSKMGPLIWSLDYHEPQIICTHFWCIVSWTDKSVLAWVIHLAAIFSLSSESINIDDLNLFYTLQHPASVWWQHLAYYTHIPISGPGNKPTCYNHAFSSDFHHLNVYVAIIGRKNLIGGIGPQNMFNSKLNMSYIKSFVLHMFWCQWHIMSFF